MADPYYVPFEPGLGSESVMVPNNLIVRVVEKVPGIEAIRDDACLDWFAEPQVENLLYLQDRRPGDPKTAVAVMRDAGTLFVAFKCMEPEIGRAHRLVPRNAEKGAFQVFPDVMPRVLTYDECVGVFLDDAHDKTRFHRMEVNINGARRASRISSVLSWTALPVNDAIDMGKLKWESEVAEADDHWRAAISVDLKALGIDPAKQPTVGINFVRWRNVEVWKQYSWCPAAELDAFPAVSIGDGYLHPDPVRVTRLDWGDREHGRNRMKLTLMGNRRDAEVVLKVAVSDREGLAGAEIRRQEASAIVSVPSRETAAIEVDYSLPFDHPNITVAVELIDSTKGEAFYRATFPLRDHAEIRIGQPRRKVGRKAPNPDPSDPRFHEKKRDYVLSRLPSFCRRTTAQGASSDFVLQSRDGGVSFDLMREGALALIADWVSSLFEEDNDRIIAVSLLTNDDWVTVHAAPRCAMQRHLTPLSMLRLGGGHCYSRAVIGAGIARELVDPSTGRRHEAWPTLVLGHVVTAVKRGDDWVMFDPSFGHFFYNRDNTDLATARELEASPDLITRVVKGKKRLVNYSSTVAQIRMDFGTIVWPAGAPPA